MLKFGFDQKALSIAKLSAHARTPLYRNGYILLLSGIISAGLGMVYWFLAARLYAPGTIGLNSALLSAVMFLSGASQLGLNSVLVYFIPRAKQGTGLLVLQSYLVSLFVAGVAGLLFGWGIGIWAPTLRFVVELPLLFLVFILSIMTWCIFTLQDSVLTGLRQTVWVPVENSLVALIKIGLLLVFAGSFQQYGIFAAWMIPTVISLLPVNWLIFGRLIPQREPKGQGTSATTSLPEMTRHMFGNYVGSLFFLASSTLLPVIVTELAGARANAYFYIPWMMATGLQLIPQNMTTALTAEVAHDRTKMSAYCAGMLKQIMRLLLPLVALIFVGAPWILGLFGPDYAREGTPLLRLLPLAIIPNVFVSLYISIARVQSRMKSIMVVQGIICILSLGMSYWLLKPYGITGIGIAWFTTQSVMATILYVTELRPLLIKINKISR